MMEGKGCTANVLMIVENMLICANAGDSRAVAAEQGRAIPLSFDHKPNLKKERERILREEEENKTKEREAIDESNNDDGI